MKKIIQSKLFLVGLLLLIIIGWYSLGKKQTQYDEYKCTTKKKSLKGVIKEIGGRANYMTILVNNLKERISLNISKEKYKKGFKESHYYEVGDSIIKEANSNEFIIKRDTSIAIYILDCDY